jgi:hypothetical protein
MQSQSCWGRSAVEIGSETGLLLNRAPGSNSLHVHVVHYKARGHRRCKFAAYQRRNLGPRAAPTKDGSNMPSKYQTLQNAGCISVQWKQYVTVAIELASKPQAAPASLKRVGASPLTAQKMAMKPGTASKEILNGHDRHECPSIEGRRSWGVAPAMIRIAVVHTTITGVAMIGHAVPTRGPGRARRSVAISAPIARHSGNASFSQNIEVWTAEPRSWRTPNTVTINSVAPMTAAGRETPIRWAAAPL